MKLRCRQIGLTAVELMATLLIIAVVAAIAVPNFVSMIRTNRALAQASLLLDALNYARSEAVTRRVQVGISSSGGNSWDQGWDIWVDTNGDYTKATDGSEPDLRVQGIFTGGATLQSSKSGNTQIFFTSTGTLVVSRLTTDSADNNEVLFQYRVNNNDCSLGKDISINLVGRSFMTKQAGCP